MCFPCRSIRYSLPIFFVVLFCFVFPLCSFHKDYSFKQLLQPLLCQVGISLVYQNPVFTTRVSALLWKANFTVKYNFETQNFSVNFEHVGGGTSTVLLQGLKNCFRCTNQRNKLDYLPIACCSRNSI